MFSEAAKKRAEPYKKIVGELTKGHGVLIKNAIGHNRRAYVLVEQRLGGECTADRAGAQGPTELVSEVI